MTELAALIGLLQEYKSKKKTTPRKGGESMETSLELVERVMVKTAEANRKVDNGPSGEINTKKLKEGIQEQLEIAKMGERKKLEVKAKPTERRNESNNHMEAYRKQQEKDILIGKIGFLHDTSNNAQAVLSILKILKEHHPSKHLGMIVLHHMMDARTESMRMIAPTSGETEDGGVGESPKFWSVSDMVEEKRA